ncbi:hypothetical protein Y032_0135g1926 [Ancylostoma ceylanicum]|uniref:Uncharacterized protein n=1 Tax=Ancylostoma ceylanicum TaxID=53326 RepID=A0A016T5M8_9BILA|nr:hypothetical protein Y032_0135g1926 [Ancylostoma ceylanicum]
MNSPLLLSMPLSQQPYSMDRVGCATISDEPTSISRDFNGVSKSAVQNSLEDFYCVTQQPNWSVCRAVCYVSFPLPYWHRRAHRPCFGQLSLGYEFVAGVGTLPQTFARESRG